MRTRRSTNYSRPGAAGAELCRAFRRLHRRRPTVDEIRPYLTGDELAAVLGSRFCGRMVDRGRKNRPANDANDANEDQQFALLRVIRGQ